MEPSERERLITKTERAVQEVVTSRAYIAELESYKKAVESQIEAMEKEGAVTSAALEEKKTEAKELRESIAALKTANTERLKEIGKLQSQLNSERAAKKFWRKVAVVTGLSAAGLAAVVLRN